MSSITVPAAEVVMIMPTLCRSSQTGSMLLFFLFYMVIKQGKLCDFNSTFPDEKYLKAKEFLYDKKYIRRLQTDQSNGVLTFGLVEITKDGMEYYEEEMEKAKHSKKQNIPEHNRPSKKDWHERLMGKITIGILIAVIAGYILYLFGVV